MTLTPVKLALAVFGLLSTGISGLAWVISFFVRYGTRLNMLENQARESHNANLPARVTRVEDAISEMKPVIAKLATLDVISARLELLAELMKNALPRSEADIRWKMIDDKFDSMKSHS